MARTYELKLKARVQDLAATRERVNAAASLVRLRDITDYFFEINNASEIGEIRLRKSEDARVVSLKVPVRVEQLQENEEYRFSVDHPDDFVSMLEKLGGRPCCVIHKKAELYEKGSIAIELSETKELGPFLELKVHGSEKMVRQQRQQMLALAEELGMKKSMIDSRYYPAILKEKEE